MAFDLVLFYTNETFTQSAVDAGVNSIIVDLETRGKPSRQKDYDTQISVHTLEDLKRARASTSAPLSCRINGYSPSIRDEIEVAIDLGVDELLLPMVRSMQEIEATLAHIDGRCGLSLMIETVAMVNLADSLNQYPLTSVYVGLNDLSIERKTRHIFVAVADGTVERVREAVAPLEFGFAGLTLPDRGFPLPCKMLIDEMARLDCAFSFLRRSFLRDVRNSGLPVAVRQIKEALDRSRTRTNEQVERDHQELLEAIRKLPDGPWRI